MISKLKPVEYSSTHFIKLVSGPDPAGRRKHSFLVNYAANQQFSLNSWETDTDSSHNLCEKCGSVCYIYNYQLPDYHAIHYHISNFVTLFIKLKDVYNLTPYTGEKRKMLLVQSFKHCLVMSCHVFVHQQAAVCPGKLTPGRECLSVCLWLDGRNGWRGDQLCGNFARDFTARTSYERSSTRSSTRSDQSRDHCASLNRRWAAARKKVLTLTGPCARPCARPSCARPEHFRVCS